MPRWINCRLKYIGVQDRVLKLCPSVNHFYFYVLTKFFHFSRPPVYDFRELQVLEMMEQEGVNGSGPNNLDKERNMVNDDPKWQGRLLWGGIISLTTCSHSLQFLPPQYPTRCRREGA